MIISRRAVLAGSASLAATACASNEAAPRAPFQSDGVLHAASDEAYWRKVASAYDVMDGVINLENGNWGLMARPVLARYQVHTWTVNRRNSYFARREYADIYHPIHQRLADVLGADAGEIAITRVATEALKALITGYNRLKAGDGVRIADLDYGSILNAMEWKAAQSGGRLVRLSVPEPVTHDALISFYDAAMAANPDVRLLLLTHVSHRTGLVIPVPEIVAAARLRGVDVIVDAAHSWGQMDFDVAALGADFVGFNLHKWIGAPIRTSPPSGSGYSRRRYQYLPIGTKSHKTSGSRYSPRTIHGCMPESRGSGRGQDQRRGQQGACRALVGRVRHLLGASGRCCGRLLRAHHAGALKYPRPCRPPRRSVAHDCSEGLRRRFVQTSFPSKSPAS
jgi:hypothetical protein